MKCFIWKLGHNNTCKNVDSSNDEYTNTWVEPEYFTEKGRKICYYPTYPGDIPGGSDSICGSVNIVVIRISRNQKGSRGKYIMSKAV